MPPYRGPQRAVRSRRQRQVDARTRRATRGPVSQVSQAGQAAGKVQRKEAKPRGVFARPIHRQAPRQARDPVGARRASRNRATQGRKQAVKTQRPVLRRFPVLASYTPKQEATIRRARVTAAKQAVKGGVPIRNVGTYLSQTHDARTLEPYRRAERQYRQRFARDTAALTRAGRTGPANTANRVFKGKDPLQASTNRLQGQLGAIGPNARLLSIPAEIVRANIEGGPHTWGQTAKGAAAMIAAAPAGVVQAIKDPSSVPKQLKADLNRRYGPLGEGRTEEFRKRLRDEGTAAELIDVATVAAPQGAVVGRGLGQVARTAPKGSWLRRFATEPRPKLRTAGNVARGQELAPNLGRVVVQRTEDRVRVRRQNKRNAKADRQQRGRPALQPRKGEVVPLFSARAQRIEAATTQGRRFNRIKREQAAEIDQGAQRDLSKLNAPQRDAVWFAAQGLVNLDNPRVAERQLRARRVKLLAKRREEGIPGRGREVKAIERILTSRDKVFTKGLRDFQTSAVARGRRVMEGDQAVRASTAEARRWRPVARQLGIRHEYEVARDRINRRAAVAMRDAPDANARERISTDQQQALSALEQAKPALDRRFAQRVQVAAREQGLPEPTYVEHVPAYRTGQPNRANRALGGARKAPAPKRSEMRLFDTGEADVSPAQYLNSLARTTKRKHNWQLIAEQVDRHALPDPSPAQIKEALGYPARAKGLRLHELRTVLDRQGVDLNDVGFWSPGLARRGEVREQRNLTGDEPAAQTADALKDATLTGGQVADIAGDHPLAQTQGWRVLTKAAHEEIVASANPSTVVGRSFDKVMGTQSRILLGYNPTWPIAQIAANIFQSMFAIKGNVADYARAQTWYRSLPSEVRKAVDDEWGTGIGTAHGRRTHIGAAANSDWINSLRAWRETATFRASMLKQKVPGVRKVPGNVADAMFAFDDAQNRFFRRAVLYNDVKRQAYRDIRKDAGLAFELQERIENIVKVSEPRERMRKILENRELFEKHARHVDDFLGNWTRFTNRERRTLKRGLLFYGFLRFATRTAFYTVPVKHPIMGSIVGKLAQLHVEEVKELLGGDEAPWAYSRVFFGKGDKLKAIDLLRINPVSGPITDVVTEGPRTLGGLASPVAQAALDQIATKKTGIGQPFRVEGSASEPPEDRFYPRVFLDSVASAAFPYRFGERLTQQGTQGDDSLLFSERPISYKSAAAKAREAGKRAREGTPEQKALELLLPFFVPKPDYTRDTVARLQRERGKKKKGGGTFDFGTAKPSSSVKGFDFSTAKPAGAP